jgi:hypothetical protein
LITHHIDLEVWLPIHPNSFSVEKLKAGRRDPTPVGRLFDLLNVCKGELAKQVKTGLNSSDSTLEAFKETDCGGGGLHVSLRRLLVEIDMSDIELIKQVAQLEMEVALLRDLLFAHSPELAEFVSVHLPAIPPLSPEAAEVIDRILSSAAPDAWHSAKA